MLSRNIWFVGSFLAMITELASALLLLRIIKARSIVKFPHFLLTEKIKTESHLI
jgi:hypothetical protein